MVYEDAALRSSALHYRFLLRAISRQRPPSPTNGQKLHANLIKAGLLPPPAPTPPSNSSLPSALFHMYATCGSPHDALRTFHHIPLPHRTVVDWTALLSCHLRNGRPADALRLFFSAESDPTGFRGDEVTMVCVFGAAARLGDVVSGCLAHSITLKRGLPLTVTFRNAAMDMYVKCGRMGDARRLFDEMSDPTVVSWAVILSGAIRWEGVESGRRVFDGMAERNEVAWTVMAAAYVEAGLPREALSLLAWMLETQNDGEGCGLMMNLNHVSICSLLSACSQTGDLTVTRWVHVLVTKMSTVTAKEAELDHEIMVGTALIDTYAKCGKVDTARKLFRSMHHRNVVTWNAFLSGLSMHGLSNEAKLLFSQMLAEGMQPDDISFVGIMSACSRSGLVEDALHCFYELIPAYGVTPKMEHYACMVDVLGRAGRLKEAETIVRRMPYRPNEVVLGSLLAACALHDKLELGVQLTGELVEMDPLNTEYHVLLSNMLAAARKQPEADQVRGELKKRGIRKTPGVSYISIDGCIHRFSAGDKSHPWTEEVYAKLDEMNSRLRLAGYVPRVAGSYLSRVMDGYLDNAGEQEEREQALFSHSERLAIALGLISTRAGSQLCVFKNIRICVDCHSAIKLISSIYGRDITVRDRNRFHCFKMGSCSCSDYW